MENELQDYSNELRKLIDKSHDAFEKQLNYISSGTLAISMIIVEKLVSNWKIQENPMPDSVGFFVF